MKFGLGLSTKLVALLAAAVLVVASVGGASAARFWDASIGSFVERSATASSKARKSDIPRKKISYETSLAPGSIIIETSERRLYFVLENGKAWKYGVGVGREGFDWSGRNRVSMKKEWPGWTPPARMRKRVAGLPAYMPGGPDNPLGARAIYIGSTLYRIHGSNEPWTIGHAVSSGCIRMTNDDVTHLYEQVAVGARIVVRP